MAHSTVKAVIVEDHAELAKYHDKYMAATTPTDQAKWANQYRWELARHAVAEELVLYPAFEKHLANGKEIADKERAEHQGQKELQYKLQKMEFTDPDYKTIFSKLQKDVSVHVIDEEATLDELAAVLDKAEDDSLAKSIERTKLLVPTYSHPSAHNKPPFETIEGLLIAPLDKIKDLFATWPTEEEKKA